MGVSAERFTGRAESEGALEATEVRLLEFKRSMVTGKASLNFLRGNYLGISHLMVLERWDLQYSSYHFPHFLI